MTKPVETTGPAQAGDVRTLAALLRSGREPTEASRAEERKQQRLTALTVLWCVLCAVPVLVYLFTGDHFVSRELEEVMGRAAVHVLPFVGLGIAGIAVCVTLTERSLRRECELLKRAPARAEAVSPHRLRHASPILTLVLLACAAGLIAAGVCNGGLFDVLAKAISICTECVGLG